MNRSLSGSDKALVAYFMISKTEKIRGKVREAKHNEFLLSDEIARDRAA